MSDEYTGHRVKAEELLALPADVEVIEFDETISTNIEAETDEFVRKSGGPWIKFHTTFRNRLVAELKGSPLAVFLVIGLHVNTRNECFPTIETIVRRTGYSRRQVMSAIKTLEGMDLIAVTRVHRKNNLYMVKVMFSYGDNDPVGEVPAFEQQDAPNCTPSISKN